MLFCKGITNYCMINLKIINHIISWVKFWHHKEMPPHSRFIKQILYCSILHSVQREYQHCGTNYDWYLTCSWKTHSILSNYQNIHQASQCRLFFLCECPFIVPEAVMSLWSHNEPLSSILNATCVIIVHVRAKFVPSMPASSALGNVAPSG